jgi:hypothetical protein
MSIVNTIIYFTALLTTCGASTQQVTTVEKVKKVNVKEINESKRTLEGRFNVPNDFERIAYSKGSFGTYLRGQELKTHGSLVQYYDGSFNDNTGPYAAVLNQSIGKRNLHQCADAAMRLRAEHLWRRKRYSEINFKFTNGFVADYDNWRSGKRIVVKGNVVKWSKRGKASVSEVSFWKYLEMVFAYAGSLSLSKELKKVSVSNMKIGDVFVKGGSPGHVVIVMDMAKNVKTGEIIFMLAQSYMPAQQTHVLYNYNSKFNSESVWYSTNFGSTLETPQWTFSENQLMRFN